MGKTVGYTKQGLVEFVPLSNERADTLLECLGE